MTSRLLSRSAPPAGSVLRGLIVEDQALIGLSLEAYLEDLGIEVCGVFVSEVQALGYLEEDTPDFAILDYSLGSGPCTNVARLLRSRGVPMIVYSGHPRRQDTPAEFGGAAWIEKPAPRARIIEEIQRLVLPLEQAAGARVPA